MNKKKNFINFKEAMELFNYNSDTGVIILE